MRAEISQSELVASEELTTRSSLSAIQELEGDESIENRVVLNRVLERLDRLEEKLDQLVSLRTVKDHYDTEEFARLVGKAEFTVREWCRLGRIKASKRRSGRGKHASWVIAHDELLRYQREGLLPLAANASVS